MGCYRVSVGFRFGWIRPSRVHKSIATISLFRKQMAATCNMVRSRGWGFDIALEGFEAGAGGGRDSGGPNSSCLLSSFTHLYRTLDTRIDAVGIVAM